MAVTTVVSPVTTATGSGIGVFGSMTNKFAIQVLTSVFPATLTLTFQVSWDSGQTYVPARELAKRGQIYIFDTPATNVKVAFQGNQVGQEIAVYAQALSD